MKKSNNDSKYVELVVIDGHYMILFSRHLETCERKLYVERTRFVEFLKIGRFLGEIMDISRI